MESVGPGIATLPSSYEDQYKFGGFSEIRPRIVDYSDEDRKGIQVCRVLKKIPDPASVTFSDPDLIQFLQGTPQHEPVVSFRSFVEGVAVAAAALDREDFPTIQKALTKVADHVTTNQVLPSIDSNYAKDLSEVEEAVFGNGEMMSWKNLLAFAWGAYWLLTFVQNPTKKRGRYSPATFVKGAVLRAAELGYTPRG